MKAIRDLLVKKKAASTTLSDQDIFYIFRKIIKEEYGNVGAEKIQPDFYKNGIIFARSESSVWSAEVFSNRSFILRKMNDELGERVVREIKFK